MEKYRKVIKNNKLKRSAPTWNEKIYLCGGSYSISNIQDYFQCILNKHDGKINNPSIRK